MTEEVKLKGFDVRRYLGRGQYASAHVVTRTGTSTELCAKVVNVECLEEQDQKLAYQEVELLRSLHHPFIVGYEESFPQGGSLVIIMEYVGGGDLRSFIRTRVTENAEPLEEFIVLTYTAQIAMAMQYIHRLNILHRYLKSSNLFLTERRDKLRLAAVGIA